MLTDRIRGLLLVAGIAAVTTGCSNTSGFEDAPGADAEADAAVIVNDVVTDTGRAPDTGVRAPLLLGIVPDHGPFTGGNVVVLRGSNFPEPDEMTEVRFGDALAQPREYRLIDSHRFEVQVPQGRAGTVDVTFERGTQRSRLPGGYTYDSFYVDPNSGSIAGNTRITLRGLDTNWTASSTVTIDSQPCLSVNFVSASELNCVTPMHAQGSVPVTVTTGADAVTVPNAFTFFQPGDSNQGGFSGGHINGSINVTVVSLIGGTPIPNAIVYLGDAPSPPPRGGLTNTMGQVTLSAPDITGPVTITATAHCFASSSFLSIDGRDATITLIPWLNRVPGVDCGPPNPPDSTMRPGVFAANVEGELVWSGPREFGPNPWFNVPLPRANERRVAFVMTTQQSIFGGNPPPGVTGTVVERIPLNYGGRGYAYSIVARPAAMAVYAFAGLERTDLDPPRFTPYVMGVARSVLGAPRARLTRVDIDMNIPLDHELRVNIHDVPPQDDGDPNRFHVENWIDLGGEGVIPRPDVDVYGRAPTDPYRLVAQPAFLGTLADARMIVRATYASGTAMQPPDSTVVAAGITSPDTVVDIGNWVGIPRMVDPAPGGTIPATRRLRFEVIGENPRNNPDMFWSVVSQLGSSCRTGFYLGDVVWWQYHFPGTNREFTMPDISIVPSLTDVPRGIYQLSLCGFRVAGFDYNNFSYQYLSTYYWTAYSTTMVNIAR